MRAEPIQQRFERKVSYEALSGCHLWTGAVNKFGYGKIGIGCGKSGWMFAHRFAYQQAKGEIPNDKYVLHNCDTPSCVNPEHLYLGSYKDNAQDRESRQRGNHVKGIKHGRSVLLPSQVYEIRDAFDTGKYSFKKLGEIYGIDGKSVANIVDRKNWNHLH